MLKRKRIFNWGVLGLMAFCLLPFRVEAKSVEEIMDEYKKLASEIKFEFNYVNFDASLDAMKEVGASEWSVNEERVYEFLFRSEIKKYIELEDNAGMDVMCYMKGETYYDWSFSPAKEYVADKDKCIAIFYFYDEFGVSDSDVRVEFDVSFNEVEGVEEYKKEALEIVRKITKNQYVVDMDSVNHFANYSKNISTFFDGDNAVTEFSNLKNAVEEYPDYTFEVGFEEIRRGDYFVGIEDGAVFIKRDGIIYGYSISEYGNGGLYFVPIGTDENDYESVLKERIDKYLGTDNEVKLEKKYFDFYTDGILRHVVNASTVVLQSLDMTIEEYYQKYNTNLEKECAKTDSDCGDYTETAIAVPAYILTLNGKEYEVGILEVDDEVLNRVGLISSKDKETGIILNSKSSNIPLDASLKVNGFELSKEEVNKLKELGYSNLKAYNFSLYSKILDKYIKEFNKGTDIYIPVLDNINLDNTKIIYLSDDLKTVEYYDIEVVSIDNVNYLKFSTKHFSNYIIANGDNGIENPDTYDGIMTWVLLIGIASLGIFGIYICNRKLNS